MTTIELEDDALAVIVKADGKLEIMIPDAGNELHQLQIALTVCAIRLDNAYRRKEEAAE